jgi:hypothetical protein
VEAHSCAFSDEREGIKSGCEKTHFEWMRDIPFEKYFLSGG